MCMDWQTILIFCTQLQLESLTAEGVKLAVNFDVIKDYLRSKMVTHDGQ
jgi:hypothetical protein